MALEFNNGATLSAVPQVPGTASARLISSETELSLWGGVNPQTGEVIDRHHPLSGQHLKDHILAIPGGRGSCSGSGVILQLLTNEQGPRGIILARNDDIITLGVIVADELFGISIPVVVVETKDFRNVLKYHHAHIDGNEVTLGDLYSESVKPSKVNSSMPTPASGLHLSDVDQSILSGTQGEAAQVAMRIIIRIAVMQGADSLIDVTQVHVDGCVYTGPASLAFAEKLQDLGGQVKIPTTLNSISVDQRRWQAQGIEPTFGALSERIATAYTTMGAKPTFTCAPYLLESAPVCGDQVAWAESNAVVYANSVLGARTMKYPDFLDICVALTGRAPNAGAHLEVNRLATIRVHVPPDFNEVFATYEEATWPLLGYCVGSISGNRIPVVTGLADLKPSTDDLKSFGAAYATMASAAMFHIVGITPEATALHGAAGTDTIETVEIMPRDIENCFRALNSSSSGRSINLVSLGNPHFSFTEVRRLAGLCRNRFKRPEVQIIVTCGRTTYGLASQAGLVAELLSFGIQFVTDTCWCMIEEPIIPSSARTIMTNSAKYAHYGPGLTGRQFRFGSLADCVSTACDTET